MAADASFNSASSQYLEYTSAVDGPHKTITAYPFTFTCWIKRRDTNASAGVGVAFSKSSVTDVNFSIGFGVLNGAKIGLFLRNTANTEIEGPTAEIGTWYFVCGVFRNSTSRELYVNGVSVGSNTTSISYPTDLNVSGVGRLGDSTPGSYLNGELAYVRIFNSELSTSDMAALMNNPNSITANRVWALDMTNSSDLGEDTSGNGWDATGTTPSAGTQVPPNIITDAGSSFFNKNRINYFYIRSGQSGPHSIITAPATFSAFIKSDGTQTGTAIGVCTFGSSLYGLFINSSGKLRVLAGAVDFAGATTVTDGNWHHVCYTINSTRNSHVLYVDGVSDGTSSSTATLGTINSTFVGNRGDGITGNTFNGYISNAQFYSRALSVNEVNEIRFNPFGVVSGLVGHYPLLLNYYNGSDLSSSGYDFTDGSCETPFDPSPKIFLTTGM
jgi:hypothetical protein